MDPLQQDPETSYKYFQKFRDKGEYRKAYRCIENMLKMFPDDDILLADILNLCLSYMNDPKRARPWLLKKISLFNFWKDHGTLAGVEAALGNFDKAREHLRTARDLEKEQRDKSETRMNSKFLADYETFIREKEYFKLLPGIVLPKPDEIPKKKGPHTPLFPFESAAPAQKTQEARPVEAPPEEKPALPPAPPPEAAALSLPVIVAPFDYRSALSMLQHHSSLADCRLRMEYGLFGIQKGFGDLLCLGALKGVERYWYQVETAKKVLRQFQGRALLCDEVGLGKCIEAGMAIKEYLMRGMVRSVLILTPATLVSQWKEEMSRKFGVEFATTEDQAFHSAPETFWNRDFIIASIHTAKRERHFEKVVNRFFDLVVVDEAHHLKNRRTLTWKLVNEIKKKFLLLLTATPVQNNLIELFNLITLLRPGQFKTESIFKREYMQRGNSRIPANKDKLRELMREVMIRNTRSAIDLKLPRRFASTIRLDPFEAERIVYDGVTELARSGSFTMPELTLQLLVREAGSSPFALRKTLGDLRRTIGSRADDILDAVESIREISKGKALRDLLEKNPGEKKLVFVQYLKTLDYLSVLLAGMGVPFAVFRGDMSATEKDEAIARFRDQVPVLLSTESGGEGRNMQFCNTIINFDLPWNPMRIEQRVGRLHRIGQTRDVFIFNFSVRDTVEDHILGILDAKINMFEMVIGEIEPILGYLDEEKEFEDIVMQIWLHSRSDEEARAGFEDFGERLVKAKTDYIDSKGLDVRIFGEDYEV